MTFDEAARNGQLPPLLELRDIWMAFPGQVVLQGVDLELRSGQVTALVGQNGSGKSTLIKILSGFHHPASGSQARIDGAVMPFGSSRAVHEAGIRFVHQELDLVDELSILDNLALVNGYSRRGLLSIRSEARRAARIIEAAELRVSPDTRVSQLSPVEKTLVAIYRALGDLDSAKVLVLDEPTAALPSNEVRRLFTSLEAEAARGLAILYVSHNLGEILEIASSVTVLRDGAVVANEATSALDVRRLAHLITGREIEDVTKQMGPDQYRDAPVLSARGLCGLLVENLSIDIRPGEIVGIAGLLGSGREELPYLLTGTVPPVDGSMVVAGERLEKFTPRAALDAGIVLVAADRKRQSAIPTMAARENLTLPALRKLKPPKWLTRRQERSEARSWMSTVDVRPRDPEKLMGTFSGGNQQKLVLSRALRCNPRVLILDEPVQGVDVAAKAWIFNELIERAGREGLAAVVCSGDAEVLAAVTSRTIIMRGGRIAEELTGSDNNAESILARSAA